MGLLYFYSFSKKGLTAFIFSKIFIGNSLEKDDVSPHSSEPVIYLA